MLTLIDDMYRGCYVCTCVVDVFLLERCPHFRGCYRRRYFRGCYVCTCVVDVFLLERCPHFRGCYRRQWSWDLKMCPIREVSSLQTILCTVFRGT